MKPLIVKGTVLCKPKHRFVLVSQRDAVLDFPSWADLTAYVREELKAANTEILHCRCFVFSKEWLQVPTPEDWRSPAGFYNGVGAGKAARLRL